MMVDINKILEGSVAVPYSQEILDCLQSACKSYMKGDSGYAKIEEMTNTFLTGRVSGECRDAVVEQLEGNGLGYIVTDNVLNRLSLYAICSCIDSEDELDRAVSATIFMNYMVVKKGRFNSLPNSTYIKEIYQWHISRYLAKKDTLDVGENTVWIDNIAQNGLQQYRYSINEEDIKQIQMLVKEASFYRMRISVEEDTIQSEKNPYVRVFKGLNALINTMGYLFYNFDQQKINSLLIKPEEEGKGKKKKLSSFINECRLACTVNNETYMMSSVLLRLIHSEDMDDIYGLLDVSFSVREFATYLYYELLLERIINKRSE